MQLLFVVVVGCWIFGDFEVEVFLVVDCCCESGIGVDGVVLVEFCVL